ncbi:hypothetical protein [Lentzea nigeriaca]|uniref:hypothetical protein n=1 Tax=Lentzea nigeriaca TaxID=1128665 RepID=UPI00195ECBC8|nr:hypothetical protein [Lentzea nigeriaca]MBM7860277.1 hypothetical protein [Lentzea nigeriaca]
MTAVLSVREHWCRPGERILWLREGQLKELPYDVPGLDRKGNPQRGLAARAARAVGVGAAMVALAPVSLAAAVSFDQQPERYVPEPTFEPQVFGPAPECAAVTAVRPWHGRSLPGWSTVPGWWVLTPARLAWLTTPDALAQLAKGQKSFMGNVAHLAGSATVGLASGLAVGAFEVVTGGSNGKPVELPEVVTGFEFDRGQLASVQPVWRDEKTPVLRAVLAVDGSGFDFPLNGPHDPMLRFTNGS